MTVPSCGCVTATPCCQAPRHGAIEVADLGGIGRVEMRVLTSKAVALLGAATLILGACGSNAAPSNSGAPTAVGVEASTQAGAATAVGASGAAASGATTARPSGAATSVAPSGAATTAPTSGAQTGALRATALAAGAAHACALISDGAVTCWGYNWDGQLGNGSATSRDNPPFSPPAIVVGLASGVRAIAVEGDTSCALMNGGNVKCWGLGAVGNGANAPTTRPLDVVGLSGATSLFTGTSSYAFGFCVTLDGGAVKCWGRAFNSGVPVAIAGIDGATSLSLYSDDHFCAVINSGGIKCGGKNSAGQLGNGSTTDSPAPVDVAGLGSKATSVFAGMTSNAQGFTCALMSNGGVKCWGATLGGSIVQSAIPVDVAGFASGVGSLIGNGGASGAPCAVMRG